MKRWLLVVFIVSALVPLKAQEDKQPEVNGPKVWDLFFKLDKEEGTKQGRALAEADIKQGIYRILVYGKPMMKTKAADYLEKQYKVHHVAIAGCCVSDGIVAGADGYNQAMKAFLSEKFKKDIFKEAETQGGSFPR
jgi:hypothetical protein